MDWNEAAAHCHAVRANYQKAREEAARARGALDAAQERYDRAVVVAMRHRLALEDAEYALRIAGRVVEERCLPVPPCDPAARGEMF